MDYRFSVSRRGRARAHPRRQSVPSRVRRSECVVECVTRAGEYITYLRHGLARLIAIIAGGIDVVVTQVRARITTTWIVAVQNLVVRAALDPTVQLGCAHRSEGMCLERGIDHLPDAIGEVALRFIRLGLLEECFEADLVISRAA